MGMTLQQKQELLRSKGFDPSTSYLDESTGNVLEGQDPEGDIAPPENISVPRVDISPKSSATTVFAKSAFSNIGGTLGAIGGGALAAEAVPASWAFPPWSNVIAGLGGAVVGGLAGHKAQELITPESVKAVTTPTQQEVTEHPLAALGGELAPSLPFFNPVKGVSSALRAGKSLTQLATSPAAAYSTLTAAERAALNNYLLNAGVNIGAQVAPDIYHGETNPLSYLKDVGVGLALNEPTRLGQKLFKFKPSFEGVPTREELLASREGIPAPKVEEPTITPPALEGAYGTEFNEPAYQLNAKAKGPDDKYLMSDSEVKSLFQREYPEIAKKALVKGEGLAPNQKIGLGVEQMRDFLHQVMQERTDLAEGFAGPTMIPQPEIKVPYTPQKTKGKSVEIQQRQEYNGGKNQGPYKYTGEEAPYTVKPGDEERILNELLKKRGLKLEQYGQTIVDEKGNPVLGKSGNPVKGRAQTGSRVIDLATSPAHPETAHHEAGHIQLMDLATSKDIRDRELVSRVFKEAGKPEITAEEFVRLNQEEARLRAEGKHEEANAIREKYIGPEEELMQFAGLEGAKRELARGPQKFKQWFKDYLSRFNLGETPAAQQFSARQKYEAPYGTRGVEGESVAGAKEKMAESEPFKPEVARENTKGSIKNKLGHYLGTSYHGTPEDYQQYQNIQKQIATLRTQGKSLGDPEMAKLFQENETVKNKYGGMPPEPPKENATSKVSNEGSILPEHKEGNASGKTTETSSSNSLQHETPSNQERKINYDVSTRKMDTNALGHEATTPETTGVNNQGKENTKESGNSKDTESGAKLSEEESSYENEHLYDEKGRPKYNPQEGIENSAKTLGEAQKQARLSKNIEEHYGEASFKAAKEAEKEQKRVVEATHAGLNPEGQDLKESFDKANFKANEAEAFSRPDVERHSEEERTYTKDPNLLPKKPIFSLATSVTDKIHEAHPDSPIHEKISTKLRNFFNSADEKYGRYGQSIVKAFENYSPSEVNNVIKYRWAKDNNISPERALTPKEDELNRTYQTLIQRPKEDAAKLGLKVKEGENFRVGGIKPEGYLPNMIDPEVLWTIQNKPNSVESKSYQRKWKEWMVKKGASASEAEELVNNYLRAQREYGDTGGPEFKAMRRAEGYGLPWDLMDKNPARAALRYGRRAANDVSYFEYIQSDPDVLKALGLKDQFGKNPESKQEYVGSEKEIQDAMKFVWGKNVANNPRFSSLMRLAGNLVMGHGTAIRNIAAIPTQIAPYDVRLRDIFNGFANLSRTRQRAYESGSARVNPAEYEYLGEMGNPDKVVKTLDNLSNILRKYQGRNLSDKFEGELLYSIGEEWAKNMIATKNERLLQRATGEPDYKIPMAPTQEDISKIASGFVRLTRGSYGPQGLPNWALTGNVAPFVALNRFGIEKWNNVAKDVIQPMKSWNLMPFLKYTLSGVMTGAMIEQLNEALSGRKGSDLDIRETMAAYAQTHDLELFAHKIIGLMQLSSYGGLMGDLAKMGSRASQGKELSYSNPIGMPLFTLATDTFGENLSAAIGALRQGEDPINVLAELAKTIPLQTIQAGRYVKGYTDEDANRKEEFRDLRTYKEATDKEGRTELKASKVNPYKDIEAKQFKKTENLEEAQKLAPELIQKAMEKAGNDVYKLKREFAKLKANSYQVMPSPETQPLEFWKYTQYLQQTLGNEKASERVAKFFNQRLVNKYKASLVP